MLSVVMTIRRQDIFCQSKVIRYALCIRSCLLVVFDDDIWLCFQITVLFNCLPTDAGFSL